MLLTKARMVLSLVVLVAAITAAAGQLGRWSDIFDAVNIFLPYLVIPAVVGGLTVVLGRWRHRDSAWWMSAAALILLAAGPIPLLISEWMERRQTICNGAPLRIVQFNLWKDNQTTPSAARWIRLLDPDLVMIEEAKNPVPVAALLRDRYPFQQSCIGPSLCSTMILSKWRPLASGGLAQADPENRRALSAAWMRLGDANASFTAVAVHLGRPWPFPHFAGERAALVRFVRSQPAATTLVAGDFNLPGWTFQMRRLEAAMGLVRRSRAIRSWPAVVDGHRMPLPLLPIDHLFAGWDWDVVRLTRGPFLGSDHYPLVIRLRRCPRSPFHP